MPYDASNSGALHRNTEKKSPTHADYSGTITVAGVAYWLDAWVKPARDGKQSFMSLSVKPKSQQPSAPPQQRPDDDSDFPF